MDRVLDLYESGNLSGDQIIAMYSGLIRSGAVVNLPGTYRRTAAGLIMQRILDPEGNLIRRQRQA